MGKFDLHDFRWHDWNIQHIAKHNVSPEEAEYVVRHAKPPYPRRHKKGTWIAKGPTWESCLLQVVFYVDENDDIYVIHAMPF